LLNVVLEPDDLADYDFCTADCQICIKNCPAGALDGKRVNQKLCREKSEGYTKKGDRIYLCNNCRKLCPNGKGFDKKHIMEKD
jgi:epoxyqueuosine reductase QueG